MKRSCGFSCVSRIAPTGQLPTQARHIVQVSRLTAIVPNGAPAGSAISRCGTGACCARCSIASAAVVRLSAVGANVGGDAHGRARPATTTAPSSSAATSARRRRGNARPGSRAPARSARRSAICRSSASRYLRRLGAGREHRDLARAERQRREPDVEPDRRDVMDFERNHARRQAASATRELRDRAAPVLGVQEQAGVAAAGLRVGGEQRPDLAAEIAAPTG